MEQKKREYLQLRAVTKEFVTLVKTEALKRDQSPSDFVMDAVEAYLQPKKEAKRGSNDHH